VIYAIRAVGTGYVKIGKANSVGKRLKELETSSPHELHIEAVANWPNEDERRLHNYLISLHVRGEWFKDGELMSEVINLFRDQENGHELWKAKCKRLEIKTAKEMRTQEAAKLKASRLSLKVLQASQRHNYKPYSTTLSPSTVRASQFMQSLMDWESNTLRSIATSLSTEKQNGETLRSVEPSQN
jgi:hypothetical protein